MRIEKPLVLLAAVTFPFATAAPVSSSGTEQRTPEFKTVSYALDQARDEERVVVTGQVIRQLDDDLFLLSDGTAEIRIDTWIDGQGAVSLPVGETISLTGLVDRHPLQRTEIYLISFEEIPADQDTARDDSNNDPRPAKNQTSTTPTLQVTHASIKELREQTRDGERVVFTATVDRRRGDDAFLLRDESGRVRLDAWVPGRGAVDLPIGETVLIRGHVDKHWLMPTEVYLHSFTPLGEK